MKIALRLGRRSSGGMDALVKSLTIALKSQPDVSAVGHVYLGQAAENSTADFSVEFHSQNWIDEYRHDLVDVGTWCRSNDIDILLCPGNLVSRAPCTTIWWPLTVAPFERIAVAAMSPTAGARARWATLRRTLAVSARLCDAFIFSSNYASQLYQASLDIAGRPSTVILPAPSIDSVPGQPVHPPELLCVSTFNRYKFAREIVQGFDSSSLARDGWKLRLVGRFPDPAYEATLRDAISAASSPESILVDGPASSHELPKLYGQASAFVFASISENASSYALIDALNYGLPSVSSFYSSTPEIVGNAALYFDPFDHDSLVEALDSLADPETRFLLQESALVRRSQLNSWSQIGASLVDFARSIG